MNLLYRWFFATLIIFVPFIAYASENRYNVPIGDSAALGPVNASITMIEFIDYQ
jgi:hypothetical protein